MFSSCQSRHQHHQCRFRQVEIGNQAIQYLKFVTGINENLCVAAACLYNAIFIRSTLHGTAAGGSHTDNPIPCFPGIIDQLCRLFRYLIIFGMHMMIQNIIFFYGTEGSQSHMERNISKPDSFCFNLLQQFLCKM